MQWNFVSQFHGYDYDLIHKHYTEASIDCAPDFKFYNMWMTARAYKLSVGTAAYDDYSVLYKALFNEYPDYVEPVYELCETAPNIRERHDLYLRCLKCKEVPQKNINDSDPEILEWKALAGFLVECYNLEKYDDAYDAWMTLLKTNMLDKVDVKYKEWVAHVRKCGEDTVSKLLRVSSFVKFRLELHNISKERNCVNFSSHLSGYEDIHIHFVWVQGYRVYSMIQYLAVRAAYDQHQISANNRVIYIYNDIEPEDNEWWEATKKYATIVHVTPPRHINGCDVPHPQHVADIMRVCIIFEFGGIYLDFDLLLIRSLNQLLNILNEECNKRDIIMCKETDNKVWNGLLIAKPYNTFLGRWIREYETKYGDPTGGCWWAGLSVETPMRLYRIDCTDVTLLDTISFLPFGFYDDHIYNTVYTEDEFASANSSSSFCLQKGTVYSQSYGVHLWETEAEKRGVLPKDKEWFEQHPSTIFAKLFGKYV